MAAFLDLPVETWLADLSAHHQQVALEAPGSAQLAAWRHCFAVLRQELSAVVRRQAACGQWSLVFEYELPRERGRRPDVLVLTESDVKVLEFKDRTQPLAADLNQVAAYARDLHAYHAASHDRVVTPVLVPTLAHGTAVLRDGVWSCPPGALAGLLGHLTGGVTAGHEPLDPERWLAAEYAPLPSLVEAARALFNHEPLPNIRRAHSAGIPDTIRSLVAIARHARASRERHLAMVTGVPGAGKTLVGLQFVYENQLGDTGGARSAVFLSGNGPLVKVLQYVLKNSVFVQDVHGFLKEYGGQRDRRPGEHIWVYDEAQRAWDASRVLEKRGHGTSEPEDFLRLGDRMDGWAMVVGLIGEGQEIHLGEEAGLSQWNDAIACVQEPWIVHCPSRLLDFFPAAARTLANDRLNLSMSLRTHLADDVQRWIESVLAGDLSAGRALAQRIRAQGFEMYVTRTLENAKDYLRIRYEGQVDKRYGLLASSKAKNLVRHGIRNDYAFTKNLREGPWYADPPSSARSCCQLHDVATEFSCQGLELDFPLVAWGDDLRWDGARWVSPPQPRSKAHDPHRLRVNSYRVLLSRGRDGFMLYVPPDDRLDGTFAALCEAGVRSSGARE